MQAHLIFHFACYSSCLPGIGFAIIVIATYISWYYNTIIAWCVYYFFSSMRADVPWKTCNNEWNLEKQCMRYPTDERYNDSTKLFCFDGENSTSCIFKNQTQTPTEQYFEYEYLLIHTYFLF